MTSSRKFKNCPVQTRDGRFDSKKELRRWFALQQMEQAGVITNLERQPSYAFQIGGLLLRYPGSNRPVRYVADFRYTDCDGKTVVEDVKSKATITPAFKIKEALMQSCHGIRVRVV